MGDAADKKPASIPDWQKTYVQSSTPTPTESSHPEDAPTSNTPLIEQAKRWLQEDSIREAPRESKVSFLEQKGLQGDDIQKLLGAADSPDPEFAVKTIYDSASTSHKEQASNRPDTTTITMPSSQPSVTGPARDVPPIITYPEFLLRPEKPPPLVTFQRLAYATYGFAGLTALTYGASKYLIQPMLESLTSARHELADRTIENLEKLNHKLEGNVSHVPYTSSSALLKHKGDDTYTDDDVETVDSDPTELFHRDIATQTSPHQSRTASMSTSTSLGLHHDANPTASQGSRLSTIHSSLTSILDGNSSKTTTETLKTSVEELQTYLDNLQFSNNSFNTNYDYIYPSFDAQKSSKNKDPDDAADKFKAEIRAVKGALLSSRTFPTSGRPGQGVFGMVAGR